MPFQETLLSFYTPDNTTFRAYVTMLIAQFTAMGLVQTPDTGQINPATVNVMDAVNQNRGYLIFRFDDDLQDTHPVFIRVDIGSVVSGTALSSGNLYYTIRLIFQVGTSTNGAGVLGERKGEARAVSYYSTGITNTIAHIDAANLHLFSGKNNNKFAFARGVNSTNTESWTTDTPSIAASTSCIKHGYFSVERSKDADGLDTGDHIIVVGAGTMNETAYNLWSYHHEIIPFNRQLPVKQRKFFPTLFRGDGTNISSRSNGDLYVFPFYPLEGGKLHNSGILQKGFLNNEFTWYGEPIEIQTYGESRLYRPINVDLFRTVVGDANVLTASRMMILWED